ncbi:WD40-repeat-containing domain protein [Gymnopilus junonius]|uniref:WD40-repeat-containing domain protein n=1 Tax=Gymnopilus junonius TaxID=109634 RepID=A0A9P5NJN1_GYMJU|nr:WD40-repeat-containing domain protein [Gymnopilus junonius]
MLVTLLLKGFKYFLKATPHSNVYVKYARFLGLKGPINCLSFNRDGALLARVSIGDDETVRIWDVSTKKCKEVLEDPGQRWGQVTCLVWLGGKVKEDTQQLAFGTGRGFLIIFCQNHCNGRDCYYRVFAPSDPVEAVDYDIQTSRLAVSSHHGNVTLYEVGRNGTMLRLWASNVESDGNAYIASSVRFYDSGCKLLIFVLETGEMICRDVKSGKEDWRKVLKSGVGHASISLDGQLLLIENLARGFDLYHLPCSSPSHSFPILTNKRCIKDGVFAEGSSVVVCGSDHGEIYTFSLSSLEPKQVLKQGGKNTEVQTTISNKDCHLIASGSSLECSDIVIWEKPSMRSRKQADNDKGHGTIIMVLNFLTILTIAYWSSGVWLPHTLKMAQSALIAMNATADQHDTPQVHISNAGYSTWDPSSTQVHVGVTDEDDEDEEMDEDGEWNSWNSLDTL